MVNHPRRREESRYIHVDSRDFNNLTESIYNIQLSDKLGLQDYNNVSRIELLCLSSPPQINEEYCFFIIENIDGKVDSTSSIKNASTVCYYNNDSDKRKPMILFGNMFEFHQPISKLAKLKIRILQHDQSPITFTNNNNDYQSFLLKIKYIEGNLY